MSHISAEADQATTEEDISAEADQATTEEDISAEADQATTEEDISAEADQAKMGDPVLAFVRAAWKGDFDRMVAASQFVKHLNMRAKADDCVATALFYASGGSYPDFYPATRRTRCMRWLLKQEGIDVNRGDDIDTSPLANAILYGRVERINLLLEAGADVNHKDLRGFTPLMDACAGYSKATVERLIKAGSHVNAFNSKGHTALDIANHYGRQGIVELLLEHRAMPGTLFYPPLTTLPALHTRLLRHGDEAFRLTTTESRRADLSKTDVFGRTALHYAALSRKHEAYAVLCATMEGLGVATDGVDLGGYTAADHMMHMGASIVPEHK
jgi:hypothetical protein